MLRKNLNLVLVFVLMVLQGTLSPGRVSAAPTSSVAPLAAGGTVVAWGCGGGHDGGQCTVPAGLSDVTAIAAGVDHSLVLKSDGTAVAWGCQHYNYYQCTAPEGVPGVTAIATGAYGIHNLALKTNGSLVGWDNPDLGNKGSFTAVGKPFPLAAGICRVFLAEVECKGDEHVMQGTACSDQRGEWTITVAKPWKKT